MCHPNFQIPENNFDKTTKTKLTQLDIPIQLLMEAAKKKLRNDFKKFEVLRYTHRPISVWYEYNKHQERFWGAKGKSLEGTKSSNNNKQ